MSLAGVARDVRVLAVGKGAAAMARGAGAALGRRARATIVVTPDGAPAPDTARNVEVRRAAHPIPDAEWRQRSVPSHS